MDANQSFELVTAAHHFLLSALPLGAPHSAAALSAFIATVRTLQLPDAIVDAVLLRLMGVLGRSEGAAESGALTLYLDGFRHTADPIERFERCVAQMLRNQGVNHPVLVRATRVVHERYGSEDLDVEIVAATVECAPSQLCSLFRSHIGTTFVEYVRNVRLEKAARLLVNGSQSVKEIWASVGYKHASDFDHHFKKHFGVTPREYRRRTCHLAIPDSPTGGDREEAPLICTGGRPSLLVVDDDDGTRDTIGRYMESSGFCVTVVSSGRHFLDSVPRVHPNVVFLDYRLPDMDGVHCLRELRALPSYGTCPVLLFSADWELELRAAEWKPLGARYLSKLCSLEEVLDAVRGLLSRASD